MAGCSVDEREERGQRGIAAGASVHEQPSGGADTVAGRRRRQHRTVDLDGSGLHVLVEPLRGIDGIDDGHRSGSRPLFGCRRVVLNDGRPAFQDDTFADQARDVGAARDLGRAVLAAPGLYPIADVPRINDVGSLHRAASLQPHALLEAVVAEGAAGIRHDDIACSSVLVTGGRREDERTEEARTHSVATRSRRRMPFAYARHAHCSRPTSPSRVDGGNSI